MRVRVKDASGGANGKRRRPQAAARTANNEGRNPPALSKYWFDNSKVDSHFAIIPTGTTPHNITEQEQKVYDLVCRSVIRMLYGPAKIEKTKVETTVTNSVFLSEGNVIMDKGWYVVDDIPTVQTLPDLSVGQKVSGMFEPEEKQTEPPKRYTDRTLLVAMISAGELVDSEEMKAILDDPSVNGIGTSATRADVIERLIEHKYIWRYRGEFYVKPRGITLIRSLLISAVKSPQMTAEWEKRLSYIAKNKEDASVFQRDMEQTITTWSRAFH